MRILWKKAGRPGAVTTRAYAAPSAFMLACSAALLSAACSVSDATESASSADPLTSGQQPSAPTLLSPRTKRVVIEIDYARGAEPFEGSPDTYPDPWKLFRDNANALFDQ